MKRESRFERWYAKAYYRCLQEAFVVYMDARRDTIKEAYNAGYRAGKRSK